MYITTGQTSDCLHWSSFGSTVVDHYTQYKSFRAARLLPGDLSTLDPQYIYVGSASRLGELEACPQAEDCLFLLGNSGDVPSGQMEATPLQVIFAEVDDPARMMEEVYGMQSFLTEWDTKLTNAYIQGASLQEMLELSQDALKNPVILLDSSMRIIAHSKNIADDDEFFHRAVGLGYTPPEVVEMMARKNYDKYTRFHSSETSIRAEDSISPYAEVFRFITNNGEILCGLTMHCSEIEETPGLIDSLTHFMDRISMYFGDYLHGHGINPRSENHIYEYYFRHLLEGREMDEETARAMNETLRFPFEAGFRLFILTGFEAPSNGYTLSRVMEAIPDARCFFYEGAIVGLTAFQSKYRKEADYTAALLQTLGYLTDSIPCQCGISRSFRNQMQMRIAYNQAKTAAELGNRLISSKNPYNTFHLSRFPRSKLYFYDDLCLHHMALRASEEVPLEQLCLQELLDLLEYDKKNNTDNYHILYTYLQSNRKTTEAAKVLHMHRNNVTYRVKRIEELFGLDLEDPQMRLKVQYSFCILDLL